MPSNHGTVAFLPKLVLFFTIYSMTTLTYTSRWQIGKIIKDQINKYIQDLINKNTSTKTKHLKTFKKQEYLNVMPFEEANK